MHMIFVGHILPQKTGQEKHLPRQYYGLKVALVAFDVSLTFWCPNGIHHILDFLIWLFRHEAYHHHEEQADRHADHTKAQTINAIPWCHAILYLIEVPQHQSRQSYQR